MTASFAVDDTTPLRLARAAAIAFPDGSVSGTFSTFRTA